MLVFATLVTAVCPAFATGSTYCPCVITGPKEIASGETATLCGPTGSYTYQWSTGAKTRCITISAPGTYTLTVKKAGQASQTCSITVRQKVSCLISGPTEIVAGGTATLCGPEGPYTYLWSTGAKTRCITIRSGGRYTLTVNASGCKVTCSYTVKEKCAISGPTEICDGGTATLCGPSGSYTYYWSTGAKTRCITVTKAGTYSLTLTSGCDKVVCSVEVRRKPAPDCVISGPSTICAGTPARLSGPEGTGLTYKWSTGETTRFIDVTAQGTYTLTVSGGGCGTTTCSKTLTASAVPVCEIVGPETLCPGQSAQLCGPEGFQGQMFSYLWSTGSTNRCITVTEPGTYTLTVSTPDCGSATCSKTVAPGNALACTITGPTDIDPGSTARLCGPSGAGLTYAWNTGETSQCITIDRPGDYSLTVTSPNCGSSSCTRTVLDRPTSSCRCSFSYPDDSNLPRSAQAFHGSILNAVVPGRDGCPVDDSRLRLWYNDRTALGLGIRQVVVYTSPTDSTVTNYPVTASPSSPQCVTNLEFGATDQSGLQTGNDTAGGGGRPIWPVLYVTDITLDKDNRAGDWQQGSTAGIPAHEVCGVWTSGVRRVFTYLGNQVEIAMDPSPAPNHWDLGAGSEAPPGGFETYEDQGYGAQIEWDLTRLSLLPGHRYRLYTMIHDGRQSNPDGGNAGHGCTRVVVAQNLAVLNMDQDGNLAVTTTNQEALSVPKVAETSRRGEVLPTSFELVQNAPNPFSAGSTTAIRFSLAEPSRMMIGVYTVAGQRVATLADGVFEAGRRMVEWNGTGSSGQLLAPGMYICRMEAFGVNSGRFVQSRKMMMVK
jgi:hypothetical protein